MRRHNGKHRTARTPQLDPRGALAHTHAARHAHDTPLPTPRTQSAPTFPKIFALVRRLTKETGSLPRRVTTIRRKTTRKRMTVFRGRRGKPKAFPRGRTRVRLFLIILLLYIFSVSSAMDFRVTPSTSVPFSTSRMISLNVEWRDQMIPLVVSEDVTIGNT